MIGSVVEEEFVVLLEEESEVLEELVSPLEEVAEDELSQLAMLLFPASPDASLSKTKASPEVRPPTPRLAKKERANDITPAFFIEPSFSFAF